FFFFSTIRPPPTSTLFPYTTLFRSRLEGVPLGLLPGTQYDESTIDLQPGDVILFASDGILESANATDEEFGLQRLSALLSAISRSEEHTSELQSLAYLVCRLLLEKK